MAAVGPRQLELLKASLLDAYEQQGSFAQNQKTYVAAVAGIANALDLLLDKLMTDDAATLEWFDGTESDALTLIVQLLDDIRTQLVVAAVVENGGKLSMGERGGLIARPNNRGEASESSDVVDVRSSERRHVDFG